MEGFIFDIQRFSTSDGPGIRTTVFVKGCPLRCQWCHNPESQEITCELIFYTERCKTCGTCVGVCPKNVHHLHPTRRIEREICIKCGRCAESCPFEALKISGCWKTVKEVADIIEKDACYYKASDGGVTISGGEPVMQADFVSELCKSLKSSGFHVAIDTSGYAPWSSFEKLLPWVDLILFDIKHINSSLHERLTGVSNKQILENFSRLIEAGKHVHVRFPLIPGHNDEDDHLHELSAYLIKHGIFQLDVIPYHDYGYSKYRQLGRTYLFDGLVSPEKDYLRNKTNIFQKYGITVQII